MGNTVAMTDEDILTIDMIGSAMAHSLKLLLVAFEEQGAAAIAHILAAAVEIRPIHLTAATYGYAVVALGSATTVVPRHKEIVPAIVSEDERCLDGIRSGILGSRISRHIPITRCIAAGNGTRPFALGHMHRGVETHHLNAIPERAPRHPRLVVVVDDEVRVDSIPLITTFTRSHDTTFVIPYGETQ